jgi:hypothetical protein
MTSATFRCGRQLLYLSQTQLTTRRIQVHLKTVFAVLFSLWAVIGNAEPPVTGVMHSEFSDVADLALRQAVLQLPQVDVAK